MYLKYFNLLREPFELSPDPEFIYFTDTHKEVYKTLLYGIESRKGFIVLTGPVGSGKTTICRLLINSTEKDESKIKIAYIFNPSLSFPELLHSILKDFGIRYRKKGSSKDYLLDVLNNFLIKQYQNDIRIVIILDEAQLLDIETLEEIRLLTNLETDKSKLLQIILCGQEELDDIIYSPRLEQLKQRINIHCKLTSLKIKDIRKYINHRMSIAGSNGETNFTDFALNKIYLYSKGIPRKINSIGDKSLLSAYALNKKTIDYECVLNAISVVEGKNEKIKNLIDIFIIFFRIKWKTLLIFAVILIIILFITKNRIF